jgi:hypothetical protein
MNYTTEDNFDFYSELNSIDAEDETVDMNKCMISHLPLTYNFITLTCKHTFNYLPLYNELCANVSHGKNNKNHCPYCRTLMDKLIPYIPLPTVEKKIGVNYPVKACMSGPQCKFLIKRGTCNANAVESAHGVFCVKHCANIMGPNAKELDAKELDAKELHANAKELDTNIIIETQWTPEKALLYKTKSVVELKKMLREKGLKVGGLKTDLIHRLLG